MKTSNGKLCGNCAHFIAPRETGNKGECWFNPPQVNDNGFLKPRPPVSIGERCGQWADIVMAEPTIAEMKAAAQHQRAIGAIPVAAGHAGEPPRGKRRG